MDVRHDFMSQLEGANSKKFQVVPSIFTEAMYLIEGKPFRFDGRNYLKTIYDTDIIYGLLKTGRQVEKSTTVSIKLANGTLLKPFRRSLFVAPLNEQVKTFSKERLAKLFRYSNENIVRRFYMSSELSEQVFMREFRNGSTLFLRNCYDQGDNIRGLSVDDLYMDEVQDILTEAIPVVQETQFASDSPTTWFTGTPKTFSNTIEGLWQSSTKGEWIVKCSHCGTYQILGLKNITPDFLRCRKCSGIIESEDIGNGFWEELRPGQPLKGFHISQMMSPRARMTSESGKGVYQKMLSYSTAKFYNEVLGLSYENADKLITDAMLDAIMDNDEILYDHLPEKFALTDITMGIDWGTNEQSFTVVTIFARTVEGKIQLIYYKKYKEGKEAEVDYQVEHIIRLARLFRVDIVGSDWGFGFAQNQKLRAALGERVAVFYYSHSQKEKIVYDDGSQSYKVRRTDVIMDYITQCIQRHDAIWPGAEYDRLASLREHHLVEQAEYRVSRNGRSEELFLNHPMGSQDDSLHSCVYAWLGMKLLEGGEYAVRAVNRAHNVEPEFFTVESM